MSQNVQNLMEEIVLQNVDSVMASQGCCTCDVCRTDVIAYALNHLPPHYVSTLHGRLMVKLSNCALQSQADVTTALSEAAILISKHPRHPV